MEKLRTKRKVTVVAKGLTTPLIATGAQARCQTSHMVAWCRVSKQQSQGTPIFLNYEQIRSWAWASEQTIEIMYTKCLTERKHFPGAISSFILFNYFFRGRMRKKNHTTRTPSMPSATYSQSINI